MTPVKMPLKYVKEMFCDRVAASKIYMKDKYDDGAHALLHGANVCLDNIYSP